MSVKNKHIKKPVAPEQEGMAFMVETLVFVFLMVVCAGGLVYVLLRLLMRIPAGITINIPG